MQKFMFARKLSKCLNIRRSKRNVSAEKITDQHLNDEYEAILRELECLIEKKSLLLSFKNDNFDRTASSKVLSKLLESRSSEVAAKYEGHRKKLTEADLLAYLTHIIIRPNCNKLCACKPYKASTHVLTSLESATSIAQNETQFQEREFNPFGTAAVENSFTQTDDCVLHLTCAFCSKHALRLQPDSVKAGKDVATTEKLVKPDKQTLTLRNAKSVTTGLSNSGFKDASTSDKFQKLYKVTSIGDSIGEEHLAKMCFPSNFATLQETSEASRHVNTSVCKQDRACDVSDINAAIESYDTSDSPRNKRNRKSKKDTDSSSDKFDDDVRTAKCFSRRRKSKHIRKGNLLERSMQTTPVETENKNDQFNDRKKRQTVQTSTDSDVTFADEKRTKTDWVCRKCGKEKRTCTGCRNTIVMPTRDSESLRFLIKMQAKNHDRRFENIMNQLNHQGNEIRRLNEMYRAMIEKHYATRLCGCKGGNRLDHSERQGGNSKYEPACTAVAIHMCDTCNVDLGRNFLTQSLSRDSRDEGADKKYKDMLNRSTKSKLEMPTGKAVSESVNGIVSKASLPEVIAKSSSTERIVRKSYPGKFLGWFRTSWDKTRRNLEQCRKRSKETNRINTAYYNKAKDWVTGFFRASSPC